MKLKIKVKTKTSGARGGSCGIDRAKEYYPNKQDIGRQ